MHTSNNNEQVFYPNVRLGEKVVKHSRKPEEHSAILQE